MQINLEEIVSFDEKKATFVRAPWEELPICEASYKPEWAWQGYGDRCRFRARWRQNGRPVCGIHAGRPNTSFVAMMTLNQVVIRKVG